MNARSNIFWMKDAQATGPVQQTRYRNSTLTLARFRHDGDSDRLYEAEKDDAFVAIGQVSNRPAHDYRFGEGNHRGGAGSSESFNFADLNSAPSYRIYGPLDNLHLHIPRAARSADCVLPARAVFDGRRR